MRVAMSSRACSWEPSRSLQFSQCGRVGVCLDAGHSSRRRLGTASSRRIPRAAARLRPPRAQDALFHCTDRLQGRSRSSVPSVATNSWRVTVGVARMPRSARAISIRVLAPGPHTVGASQDPIMTRRCSAEAVLQSGINRQGAPRLPPSNDEWRRSALGAIPPRRRKHSCRALLLSTRCSCWKCQIDWSLLRSGGHSCA